MNSLPVQQLTYPDATTPAEQAAISLTQNLIRIPSLTAITPDLAEASEQSLDYLEKYISDHGATCHRLQFEGDHEKWGYPVDNLYAEWTFGSGEKHLCFMGHTDVVPVGDQDSWTVPPFSGEIKDNWIYGRGATDMKAAVATFCAAVVSKITSLEELSVTISLIITTDEEWAAINGSKKVLAWLKKLGKTPDAILVGEPSSQDSFGTNIKIGRRGSLCGTLTVKGIQGHAAYQELFDNPNRALTLACTILNTIEWTDKIKYFPKTNFEVIAQNAGDLNATAIVPGTASASWNIRYSLQYTAEQLHKILADKLTNPPEWAKAHPDYNHLSKLELVSNLNTASLPYYSSPGNLAKLAQDAIEKVTGTRPELDGSGGTTDGRFVHQFFPKAEIIELGLPEKGGLPESKTPDDYGTRGGMHQVDERCKIQDIKQLLLSYQEIITQYALSP